MLACEPDRVKRREKRLPLCRQSDRDRRMSEPTAPTHACDTAAALTALETTIRARLDAGDGAKSYVASLAAKGPGAIAQKVGEEATETVIAALTGDNAALTGEAADLVFHLTVLLATRGLGWADIAAELDRRSGVSGHDEKAARRQ
jgi:phosphoribosyl-ATP pyrophosphohydrolase